jgi:transposase-like protein
MSEMVGKGSKYTDEDRRRAVVEYYVGGNMAKVSTSTGIPESTLCEWKKTDWWVQETEEVRSKKGDEFDANLTKLIDSAFEEAKDRVEQGDYRVNKEGKLIRVPMSGRDLVIAGATVYDKQRLHRNEPTSISAKSEGMEALAAKFAEIERQYQVRKVNSIQGECEELE